MPLHASRWSARAQKSSLSSLPSLALTDRSFLPSFSLCQTRFFSCSFFLFLSCVSSIFIRDSSSFYSMSCYDRVTSSLRSSSISPQWLSTSTFSRFANKRTPSSTSFRLFLLLLRLSFPRSSGHSRYYSVSCRKRTCSATNLPALHSYLTTVHSLCTLPTQSRTD